MGQQKMKGISIASSEARSIHTGATRFIEKRGRYYTLATKLEGRATEPLEVQRCKELEAVQLGIEEARGKF